MMSLGKTNLWKKWFMGIAQMKQQYIGRFFGSLVKIIFYFSLEIMEGSCYVA